MTFIRAVLVTCALAASGFGLMPSGGTALAQSSAPGPTVGAAAKEPTLTLQMPALPDPVAVAVKAATTAVLVSDMIDPTCKVQPRCTGEMVPAIVSLLAKARKAGAFVAYSTRATSAKNWLPEVAPHPGDPMSASKAQDRFYDSQLDSMLKAKGTTTLVIVGWKISGSVLYTSVGATLRGYTVVVPKDASRAASDYEEAIGIYQILNQNSANARNEPLKPRTSTLSRSDLITFQ
jgi:nicotinamidase-related amidase